MQTDLCAVWFASRAYLRLTLASPFLNSYSHQEVSLWAGAGRGHTDV